MKKPTFVIVVTISIILIILSSIFLLSTSKDYQTNTSSSLTPTRSAIPRSSIIPEYALIGIDEAVIKITSALQATNASKMESILRDDVTLVDRVKGIVPSSSEKTIALKWLNSHWGRNLSYISKNYSFNFGYWEIETKGWADVSSDKLAFRMFKYDTKGDRTNSTSGEWLIYAVVF